ncbi:MAG: ThiF family adenylyltransferase [Halothiobacillus sp.]|jgi:hypothetical protein
MNPTNQSIAIQSITKSLNEHWSDSVNTLKVEDIPGKPVAMASQAWRLTLPTGAIRATGIDQLILVIDKAFPYSQPRVVAPQAGSNFTWPHVEKHGLLCLRTTIANHDAGERALRHLQDAINLLNFNEEECQTEFEREFVSYWHNRMTTNGTPPLVLSLIQPGRDTHKVFFTYDSKNNRYIVADDESSLTRWMEHAGVTIKSENIGESIYLRLARPWTPNQYPEFGRDVLNYIPSDQRNKIFRPNTPILFGARTSTGPVIVCTILQGPTDRTARKPSNGFRKVKDMPSSILSNLCETKRILRLSVKRVDGKWVHGRDHDPNYSIMRNKSIAIIGCGAIGSALARLLAQSGVGNFHLVDFDYLNSCNIARHALGMNYLGVNKADGVRSMLAQDFPHIETLIHAPVRFQHLNDEQLYSLSQADLIISAGVDFDCDAAIDAWRKTLDHPPSHICTWAEAYALAGHAVLLQADDSLLSGFDENERPLFRISEWPPDNLPLIAEAGCGNLFQPHGAMDLQPIITLAGKLAIETLLGQANTSTRREWLGDLAQVEQRGGSLRAAEKNMTNLTREAPWISVKSGQDENPASQQI